MRGRPLPCATGNSGSRASHSSFVRSLGYLWPRRLYRGLFAAVQTKAVPFIRPLRNLYYIAARLVLRRTFPTDSKALVDEATGDALPPAPDTRDAAAVAL